MIEEGDGPRPRYIRLEAAAKALFIAGFDALGEGPEALDFPDSLGSTWSELRA